jgi:F-type H+-transporting ATPase subunit a
MRQFLALFHRNAGCRTGEGVFLHVHFCSMRLIKITILWLFLAGWPMAPLLAQSGSGAEPPVPAPKAAVAETAVEDEPTVSPAASVLWRPLGIPITNAMLYTWVIGAIILIVVRAGTTNLQVIPSGLQNAIEMAVESLEDLTKGLLEPKVVSWVFPLVATFFIFSVLSNLMALLPGIGSVGFGKLDAHSSLPFALQHAEKPLFRAPTADANTTVAMAMIFFIMSSWWALRYNGPFGLIRHVFGVKGGMKGWVLVPLTLVFAFIGTIEVVSILIRPVALAMRLYGNIYGGESVLAIMLHRAWGLPAVPFYFLELVVAVVQALVFTLLCIAFISTLCSHDEGEGDHKHAH